MTKFLYILDRREKFGSVQCAYHQECVVGTLWDVHLCGGEPCGESQQNSQSLYQRYYELHLLLINGLSSFILNTIKLNWKLDA